MSRLTAVLEKGRMLPIQWSVIGTMWQVAAEGATLELDMVRTCRLEAPQ